MVIHPGLRLRLLAARGDLVDPRHRAHTVGDDRGPVALGTSLAQVAIAVTGSPARPLSVSLATAHAAATAADLVHGFSR